ncbi:MULTISPECIES: dihydrodipicolinate synthase family protein [Micrococcales]|uniref:dihydrodipicolinate synthase family protein n=1 Tax=Micrococcales TaxID=85006 RepID=UPI0004AA49FE|nr:MULTISPECIES: dihydrodipicolinate synthase family protein [Micrococcales]
MSAQPAFHGVIPPVITPRTAEGAIDREGLQRVIRHLLDGGVHGLFMLGSSAETPYMSNDERREVVELTAEYANGSVPVIVGANDQTAVRVADEARRMTDFGADAVVVSSPYYVITDRTEILDHFRCVREAVDVPVFAYNVPVRTHIPLSVDVLAELAQEGTIVGVKDSSNDDVSFRQLRLATRDLENFSLFTGHEVVCDGAMLSGADGLVPGLGNVDPAGYVRLYEAAKAGDWEAARREQDRLADLFTIVTCADAAKVSGGAAGLGAFKSALVELGMMESNAMSRPMASLDDKAVASIRKILERNGLL